MRLRAKIQEVLREGLVRPGQGLRQTFKGADSSGFPVYLISTAIVMLLFAILGAWVSPVSARIYKYVDKYGVVHLTNSPEGEDQKVEADRFEPVKLEEPMYDIKGSWDTTNQVSEVFKRIYDRLHQKKLLDEEEMKAMAEKQKEEDERKAKEKSGTADGGEGGKTDSSGTGTATASTGGEDAKESTAEAPKEEKFIKPWWGIKVRDISRDDARSLKLEDTTGIIITEVYPGSPAASGAVSAGNVIMEAGVDAQTLAIASTSDFANISLSLAIDKNVRLTIYEPQSEMTRYLTVTIKNIPEKSLANDWF